MYKLVLNVSLFAVAATAVATVGAVLLLLLSGKGCVGHGICDFGIAAIYGVLFGPVVYVVFLPLAASVLAAFPAWRTKMSTAILWSGVVLLVVTGPVALYWSINNGH